MENTYYNPLKIKVIKAKARENMLGNYGRIVVSTLLIFVLVSLVNGLFTPIISYNPGLIQYAIYYVASFIVSMLASFFFIGVNVMHLHAARGKEINYSLLAFPVQNGTNRFLTVAFVLALINFIQTIPSQLLLSKAEVMMSGDTEAAVQAAFGVIGLSVVTVIVAIVCLILLLAFSLAPYLLIDNPDMSGKEALLSSFRYMKGKKMRMFLLELSFIGLFILGLFTFCLAYLWILPYMEQSLTVFYETVVQPEQSNPEVSDYHQNNY